VHPCACACVRACVRVCVRVCGLAPFIIPSACPAACALAAATAAGKLPLLGICYGAQEIVNHFGGRVERAAKREFGFAELRVAEGAEGSAGLFAGVPVTSRVSA
jgi:GMP synthase-like glutamine amidotransferase